MLSESSIHSVTSVRCSGSCGPASATARSAVNSARRRHAGSGGRRSPAAGLLAAARRHRSQPGHGYGAKLASPAMQPANHRQQHDPEQPQRRGEGQQTDRAWIRCRSSVCCHGCATSQSVNAMPLRAQKLRNRPVIAARSPAASAFTLFAGARLHPRAGLHVHEIEVARHLQFGLGRIGHLQRVQRGAALEQRAQVAAHLVVGEEVADGEDRGCAMHVPRTNAELGALTGARRLQFDKPTRDGCVVVLPAPARDFRQHVPAKGQQSHPMAEFEQRVTHRRRHAHRRPPLGRAVHRHGGAGVEQRASSRTRIRIRSGARSAAGAVPSAASRCGGPRRRRHSRGDRDAGCRRRRDD